MIETNVDTLDLEGWELSDNQVPDIKDLHFKVKEPERLFQKFLKKSKGEVFHIAEHEDLIHIFIPTNVKLDKIVNINVIHHESYAGYFYFEPNRREFARLLLNNLPPNKEFDPKSFLKNLLKVNRDVDVVDELTPDLWTARKERTVVSKVVNDFKMKKGLNEEIDFNYAKYNFNGTPILKHYRSVKIIEVNEDYALCQHVYSIKKFKFDKIHLGERRWGPDYLNITMRNIAGGIYISIQRNDAVPRKVNDFLKAGMDPQLPRVNTKKNVNEKIKATTADAQTNDPSTAFAAQGMFAMTDEQALSLVGQEIVLATASGRAFTMIVTAMQPAKMKSTEGGINHG